MKGPKLDYALILDSFTMGLNIMKVLHKPRNVLTYQLWRPNPKTSKLLQCSISRKETMLTEKGHKQDRVVERLTHDGSRNCTCILLGSEHISLAETLRCRLRLLFWAC
ncbi:hypothetical protein M758_7G166300, partial [Ceratodon purpureus]